MEILSNVDLEETLLEQLISSGRDGHDVARAHHNDPGSNGFTFGNDRYHRSCELAKIALETHGFAVRRVGAALHALRGSIELHFATARTSDVQAPSSFDMNTDARIAAGAKNFFVQPSLEGIDEALRYMTQIIHLVWSGNEVDGLIAVHLGRLVAFSDQRVVWNEIKRIDTTELDQSADKHLKSTASRDYADQDEPVLGLSVIPRVTPDGERTHGIEK